MATRLVNHLVLSTAAVSSLQKVSLKTWPVSSALINHITPLRSHQVDQRLLHTSPVLPAGHSKWHNIKHIKAAQDKKRGQKSSFLAQKIQNALVRNSETDPKLNTELASLIKWARSNNIPNDVIDKTIERQVMLRDPKSITVFDGRGPSNTGIVLECFSLKPHHTKGLLQGMMKKYGFNLSNSASDLFEHKGIIDVALSEEDAASATKDPDSFSLDQYIDMAIEVGAEDVSLEYDGEKYYLQFVCNPNDVTKVHKGLQDANLTVTNGERTYVPTMVVPVSQDFMDTLDKLIEKLDLQQDVIKYYFNVELESS